MKTLKTTSLCLLLLVAATACKKNKLVEPDPTSTTPQVATNHDLIKSNSTEYFIADVEGVDGLTKLNVQDGDGFTFDRFHNRCPISTPFALMSIKKEVNGEVVENMSLFFNTETRVTQFRDALIEGDYTWNENQAKGDLSMSWGRTEINNPETGQTAYSLSSRMNPEQQFTLDIQTIDGEEYAVGTFSATWHSGDVRDGFEFKINNGIFKFKLD